MKRAEASRVDRWHSSHEGPGGYGLSRVCRRRVPSFAQKVEQATPFFEMGECRGDFPSAGGYGGAPRFGFISPFLAGGGMVERRLSMRDYAA